MGSPLKIAMIGQKRTGSREGGVEVVVGELARRMAALGHEVTCYDRAGTDAHGDPAPSEPYERDGVRIVPVRTVDARGMAALSSAWFATRAALRNRPDVIHYHAEGPCNALPMAARAGVPTVATIHGLDWQRAKWGGLATRTILRGERCAARHADALIVLSRAVQSYFRDRYGRETVLIPNGVNPAAPRPAHGIEARWGLASGSYALFVGRIVPEKRVELLLDAWRGLPGGTRLVVAGGASDSAGCFEGVRTLAARDPRVVMVGHVEGELLAELYANARIFVLPSDVEGMPMALLEAMSYGLPCTTSDISECADVLAGAGVTFPVGDAAALRDALAALLAEPVRAAALGEAAKHRVESKYSWDSVAERTIALYQRVADGEEVR